MEAAEAIAVEHATLWGYKSLVGKVKASAEVCVSRLTKGCLVEAEVNAGWTLFECEGLRDVGGLVVFSAEASVEE